MTTYFIDILLWLYFIVSTFISVREWILTRRRIRNVNKHIDQLTKNQLLMLKELMKLKGTSDEAVHWPSPGDLKNKSGSK